MATAAPPMREAQEMDVDLHPDLATVAALAGTWAGRGRGRYPTIEPFEYEERVSFTHVGKPWLAYEQRTRHRGDGRALHAERGYLRAPAPGRIELVLAHPTGIVEVEEGTVVEFSGGTVLDLRSTAVATTASAKQVRTLERRFMLSGDVLRYRLAMAAVGQPLTHHLEAELHRAS